MSIYRLLLTTTVFGLYIGACAGDPSKEANRSSSAEGSGPNDGQALVSSATPQLSIVPNGNLWFKNANGLVYYNGLPTGITANSIATGGSSSAPAAWYVGTDNKAHNIVLPMPSFSSMVVSYSYALQSYASSISVASSKTAQPLLQIAGDKLGGLWGLVGTGVYYLPAGNSPASANWVAAPAVPGGAVQVASDPRGGVWAIGKNLVYGNNIYKLVGSSWQPLLIMAGI